MGLWRGRCGPCRNRAPGTCGACRVKLNAGEVSMTNDDALTEQDKADGYVLACQAQISSDVTVEA
ncbi:MAG TPA: hypothetical protein DDW48_03800 [Methyloceanibacter sp.]|nr:hypothetical protein [Methyloceanibacter sp.]